MIVLKKQTRRYLDPMSWIIYAPGEYKPTADEKEFWAKCIADGIAEERTENEGKVSRKRTD